ncbi:sensor domain-containing diguanylate cyclase [Agarivorans sp. MS3-6]|uniref:sensor domain-containing diguanylate cyclase n=1 Tax=Agarivorans sp. TSD2052 TaxID=2937286 RepID=UPI00200E1418|nr:diguanylate cyclase [Agarivorans sp. TSD2052]UPW19266.1 diguanylate cyclase [Agarivorans sp. TSD2052]
MQQGFYPAMWMQFTIAVLSALLVIVISLWIVTFRRYKAQRAAMRKSPAAQLMLDANDQQVVFANPRFCDLLQLSNNGKRWLFSDKAHLGQLVELLAPYQQVGHIEALHWQVSFEEKSQAFLVYANLTEHNGRELWFINAYENSQGFSYLNRIEQEQKLFANVLNSIPEFIYFKDSSDRLLGCNQAWAGFHGLKPGELAGKRLSDFLTRKELERSQHYDKQVLSGEPCQHTEWFSAPDSRQILLQNNIYPLKNQKNEVTGVLNVSYDVTKWHELNRKLEQENQNRISSEKKLGRQNNLIRTVFHSSPDPLGFIDDKGHFIGGNEPFAKMFGYTSDDLLGKHLTEVLSEEQLEQHQQQNNEILTTGKPLRYEELVYLDDGHQIWYEVIKGPYQDDTSGERGIIFITRDVTERKATEQQLADAIMQLQELSFIDSLTQVANRRSFDEKLQQLWLTHRRENVELSLLLLDIDCFKQYNDNYGHQKGDDALRQVAKLISRSVKRGSDLVARYGGEEFAILLPNTGKEGAKRIAENVLNNIAEAQISHQYSDVEDYVSVSIGLATIVPEQGMDYGEMVRIADLQLYRAKHQGKARYCAAGDSE